MKNRKHFALLFFFNIGGKNMVNVFMEKSAKEMSVKLSDGRIMPLENHVKDLKKDNSKKELTSEAKDEKVITKELKVGEWFLIDRNVINENKEKIHSKCIEIRGAGEDLWERFKKSDKIASQNPDQYPRVMEVYIFKPKRNKKCKKCVKK